jgi:formylglycine-generating enzyme required for sulfatase activity
MGRAVGSARVYRGGSWISTGSKCRAALRDRNEPDFFRYHYLGFRLARTIPSGSK